LRRHFGKSIGREGRNGGGHRFQHVDPLFERRDGGLQLLDVGFESGETIAHDVTPLLTD
jgi:hypothetical protein